ncbi:hypothetical protein PIB30_006596 [Stylosanthes scabra]|uniref:Uncharacterized protein n=1 Tax=Stylosanthes scabra TaxID=79078 RepID=A0ABU6Y356_9FABA|nr:hypothetical protein [Stylosanthes scabra]
MANSTCMFPSPCELGDDLARNWRIGGGDGRVNIRTAMDCAWMLDGAMDNCVYALSLASSRLTCGGEPIRICTKPKLSILNRFVVDWNRLYPRGLKENHLTSNRGFESTSFSRFHKLPRIESSRLVPEPIRSHTDYKFNVQNALRIDSPSSESIPMSRDVVLEDEFSDK